MMQWNVFAEPQFPPQCSGDMPPDIQEALFETAMKGRDAERDAASGVPSPGSSIR
jgi:hypothetical protein